MVSPFNTMKLFRCDEQLHCDQLIPSVYIHEFVVTKETPCGFWVDCWLKKKWVANRGKKRYAWPTVAEAIVSFKARKARQIKILKAQLQTAELALAVPEHDYIRIQEFR